MLTSPVLHVRLAMRLIALASKEQARLLSIEEARELIQVRKDLEAEMSRLAAKDLARPDHPFHKLGR